MTRSEYAMTFEDALPVLKAGQYVQRAGWPSNMYIGILGDTVFQCIAGNPVRYTIALQSVDILAGDWYEAFPTKEEHG